MAKKSKAGFGKVHEELYRLYSESFGTSDKSAYHSSDTQQRVSTTENVTSKSKVGLRQRWSNASLFWSSTGHEKLRPPTCEEKFANNSFVSYIPEEKEGFDSSTGSAHDYDTLSEDLKIMKQENQTRDKEQKEIESNKLRFTMPHLNLTEEAIYTNDRVIHVEKIVSSNEIEKKEDERNSSDEYSIPKLKTELEKSHEIDDYVNLRSPCEPLADIIDKHVQAISRKEIKGTGVKVLKRNTIGAPNKTTKQSSFNKKEETSGDSSDDEDHYLPPTNWTTSCHVPLSHKKLDSNRYVPKVKKPVSPLVNSSTTVTNSDNSLTKDHDKITDNDGVDETDEIYYVLPSQFKDPDYENVPKAIKNSKNAVSNSSKIFPSLQQSEDNLDADSHEVENHDGYDRPVNWVRSIDNSAGVCPMPTTSSKSITGVGSVKNVDKENDSMYTKVVKERTGSSSDEDYSVPTWTRPTAKTDGTEGLYTKIVKGQKRDSSDGDYSVPTFTKLVAKDYNDSGTGSNYSVPGTGSNYSVPRGGIRPVKSGNNSVVKSSVYSVPRSQSISNGDSSLRSNKIVGSESVCANVNANTNNNIAEFYSYSVDEVVECLHDCALAKLANICKEEQLDGEYFRTLKTEDLQKEPFHMNWYHITKLFKIIGGWRPKTFRK